jgi:hypothetical protein
VSMSLSNLLSASANIQKLDRFLKNAPRGLSLKAVSNSDLIHDKAHLTQWSK